MNINKGNQVPTTTPLNSVQKFLIWSAGADQEVLSQESCRTERYKYESIGTTVILTAIMAFCSGGYALFTVFGSLTISISLGFIWANVIFNLDRFFILTASQNKSSSKLQFWVGATTRLTEMLNLVTKLNISRHSNPKMTKLACKDNPSEPVYITRILTHETL